MVNHPRFSVTSQKLQGRTRCFDSSIDELSPHKDKNIDLWANVMVN